MIHTLALKNENLQGSFSNGYKPILTVNSGDNIRLTTPDIQWGYSPEKGTKRSFFNSREREERPGHPLIGPIAINGAKPGDVLEVKINDIVPAWYGQNWAGGYPSWQNDTLNLTDEERIQLDWELNANTMTGKCMIGDMTFSVGLKPFMGVMGVAPAEPGVHGTAPPRYCGGNIDCKELVRGSSLFLRVSVNDALFSIGDGHAIQGDGEVSGTAIECPMDLVDITLHIRKEMQLNMPIANTPAGWLTFGFEENLNNATAVALDEMVKLIQQFFDIKKTEATALASATVDLHITQVVNGVKGVHAILPHGAIR